MTNTASANFGWEVAGGKKAAKKTEPKTKDKKDVPKIDILPPIQTSSTIYDLIRESDDEEINNNKSVKSAKAVVTTKMDSPKKTTRKELKESLNLVNTSMVSVQKKKPNPKQGPKNTDQELESALKDLKLDEFEKQLSQLESLFPNNNLVINENLIAFLNKKLEPIPEIDPNPCQEQFYPISMMEKSVLKFLNVQLTKLNKNDAEKLFEFCLNNLFFDNQKIPSNHGHKIAFQLISKLNPNLSINLEKFNEKINANRHRHQRLLIALWALGQFGYYNLENGLKNWFDSMLAQLNTKGCANFIIFYLNNLLEHHKIAPKSKIHIKIDQYDKIYELVNDKNLNLSKEAAQKLKNSFDLLRNIFKQDVVKESSYFEALLHRLPAEKCPRQDDIMELLLDCLLKNKDSLLKWKQCYSKNLAQSVLLLEEVSAKHFKELKSLKYTRDTFKYFDEQTTHLMAKLNISNKDMHPKAHHFARSKSNKAHSETDLLKKFSHLVKSINQTHYKKSSLGQMVFKTFFYSILAVSLFFYWDANYNKSIYTNSVQKQLRKYGLLDHTLKVINSVKQLIHSVQKTLSYYIPIWQRKFRETVVPLTERALKTSKEYGTLVWVKSEPYRDLIVQYTNEGVKYVEDNYPFVLKNLNSCGQLALDYIITVSNFVAYYLFSSIDYVGVNLMGLKRGELENVIFDGFRFILDKIADLLIQVANYINKL